MKTQITIAVLVALLSSVPGFAQEEEKMDYDRLSQRICVYNSNLHVFEKEVQREREIGKISGYENRVKLYELGRSILRHRESVKNGKILYKRGTGKNWSPKLCDKKEEDKDD